MKFTHLKKSALCVAIVASFNTAAVANVQVTKAENVLFNTEHTLEAESNKAHKLSSSQQKLKQANQQNCYIVRLSSEPVVKAAGALNSKARGNKLQMESQAAKSRISELEKERSNFSSALAAAIPNAQVERHYDTLINAVVVKSNQDIYTQLKKLPQVTQVYKEEMFHETMDASLNLVKAKDVWQSLGGDKHAGKGVRVAIVDSGIVPTNPMFAGDGFTRPTENMPTDDYCSTVDPSFCNDKLIVARYSMPTFTQPDYQVFSPLDVGGHGTHVAGTAAGNMVSVDFNGVSRDIAGVAPGAYIMAYKALFTNPETGRGSGSNIMLIEALEHALEDGADVINNSWGGGYGAHPSTSVYAEVFENIEKAGVVAVVSAGNGGPDNGTIGGPANLESVLSVANTTHGRVFGKTVSFGESDVLAVESSATDIKESISGNAISALMVAPDNFEGCEEFTADTFKDSIAVISRGTCAFSTKVQNAANAGAAAVIVYNNRAGGPIIMSVGETAAIPAVMVGQADSVALLDAAGETGVNVTIDKETKAVINTEGVDTTANSSSRGPNGDPGVLKPNVAAPGSDILSSYLNNEDGSAGYALLTGTSMSGPHIAGAAAVIKGMNPDWNAQEIKSAITNTSVTDGLTKTDAVTPADAFDVGAGRLDMVNAANTQVTFGDLGLADPGCVSSCTFVTSLKNMTGEEMTVTISAHGVNGKAMASVGSETVTLKAHGDEGDAKEIDVTLNLDMADFEQWQFARLEVHSSSGQRIAHLPLAAFNSESSLAGLNISGSKAALSIDKESFATSMENGSQILASADDKLNLLQWSGKLATSSFSSSLQGGINFKLLGSGLEYKPNCTSTCDDSSWSFSLPFKFAGKSYETMTVTTNGLIVAGSGTASGTGLNTEIPSTDGQNSLIAPFWTDFDLDGTAADDSGAGTVSLAILNIGAATPYIVVEWADAALYDDNSGNRYTVQAWFAYGGDVEDVFYNYVEVPNLPENLTIGAENSFGNVGLNYHYNGEGSSVAAGQLLQTRYNNGGSITLSANVSLADNAQLKAGVTDKLSVIEDSASDALDVLVNDTNTQVETVRLSATMGDRTEHAVQKYILEAPSTGFDATTLAVTTAPQNGTAEVVEGKLVYTPNANFFGTDTLSYSAKTADGIELAPTMVEVTVTNVNDAPTADAAEVSLTATAGATVTLAAAFTDVDGETLNYAWEQVSGTSVSISDATAATPTISAPSAATAQTLVFKVTASDVAGESASATVTVNVQAKPAEPVEPKKDSGSMFWMLLAAPLALLRRRKAN
jgi:minor extracellular serine protease Vpr